MKKHVIYRISLILIFCLFSLWLGFARVEAEPTSSLEIFPKLPPSSICTKDKIEGIWKLLIVYEVPPGGELRLYTSNPLQYYLFNHNTLYGEYMSVLRNVTLREVRDFIINQQSKTVQQYLVDGNGTIFFYKNSVAVDSLACFIVENYAPPFVPGQLLLMPPEKAAASKRLLKVYQKVE